MDSILTVATINRGTSGGKRDLALLNFQVPTKTSAPAGNEVARMHKAESVTSFVFIRSMRSIF